MRQYATMHDTLPSSPLRFAWEMARPYWPRLAIAAIFVALGELAGYAPAYVGKLLIDYLTQPTIELAHALTLVAWLAAGSIGIAIGWRIAHLISELACLRIAKATTMQLFTYTRRQSYRFFAEQPAGSLGSQVTGVADQISEIVTDIIYNVPAYFIGLIGGMTILFSCIRG